MTTTKDFKTRKHNRYTTPSSLLGYCAVKNGELSVEPARRQFIDLAGREPNLLLETASYVIHLLLSPSTQIGTDSTGNVKVILHGEIYDVVEEQATYLAEQFARYGDTFAKNINGSFAILLVDQQKDRVALIADRLNSRRIFWSRYGEGFCLSSKLVTQLWKSFELDPIGIAWCLSNGVIHNSRTLFDGVSVFERACIHELTREGFKAKRYWLYQFNSSTAKVNQDQLTAELATLLTQAVQRRLYDNPDLFLSLSAGYDATGILGVLAFDLNVPHVHCFSYVHGMPQPDSDEYLSMLMANSVDYSHEMVESYTGNLIDHILENAEMGQGLFGNCDEVGAWKRLAQRFSSVECPVVLVGDVSGSTECRLRNHSDVLTKVRIGGFEVLSWLAPLLPNGIYEKFKNGLAEDMNEIVRSCPPTTNLYDTKDFLYLDQRLNNHAMPWRENFAGQFVTVRNPLLDNDILDFMTTVPSSLRQGKRLYCQTVTTMYSKLFQFPRAKQSNFKLNLRNEFRHYADAIKQLIERDSRLDEIIPPEVLLKLLKDVLENDISLSWKEKTRERAKNLIASVGIKKQLGRYMPPQDCWVKPDKAKVLMRLLVLRTTLSTGNGTSLSTLS